MKGRETTMIRWLKVLAVFVLMMTAFFNLPEAMAKEQEESADLELKVTEEESQTDWDLFLVSSNSFPDEMFNGIEMY